ncbi:hypothetical protein O6H91_20G035400 [Diphasiastrum complanatum]|uniref:Uncharacterized protein n=1 Tax=Diphasiastrum complanatum TaxID=34168 RepID=A0ACC2AP78_DIPCM|nr:hypothetical protein O6H91_20G035400 [Diphasiastrum complanatum]
MHISGDVHLYTFSAKMVHNTCAVHASAVLFTLLLVTANSLAPIYAADEETAKLGLEVKQSINGDEDLYRGATEVHVRSQEQANFQSEGLGHEGSEPPPLSRKKVAVGTVALLTLGMAAATGLGAVPFFFMNLQSQWAGICNGIASGVMLAASFDLIQEGQRFGSGTWVVFGILMGGLFILCSQKYLERFGEVNLIEVKGADARRMVLVVAIMTLHSFGEGSGVGVSFAGPKGLSQGIIVTLAIAVHNIPEGLAVSMVLASRGVSARNAMLWSIFTSMPQPLVAVPAFICAEAFQKFLPFCMGFAAGCMVWMVIAEVIPDSFKEAAPSQVASAATVSVAFMEILSTLFESIDEIPRWQNSVALLWSLLFGLGPFFGGLILVLIISSIRLPLTFLAATASGLWALYAYATTCFFAWPSKGCCSRLCDTWCNKQLASCIVFCSSDWPGRSCCSNFSHSWWTGL